MTMFGGYRPSLKRRLLLTLLLPLCGILLGLGAAGAWLVHRVVQSASDRVLSGSLQAISETLAMQKGYLTMDLPPSALGMLENADRDNVYYSVSYRGKLVTGYPELSVIKNGLPLEEIEFRNSAFRGMPIRVASEARLVPPLDSPVIVQVAETTNNRAGLANRMLTALSASELFLLLTVATLVFLGVGWGLRPLSTLRREVELRNSGPDMDFAPLPLSLVPQEALPFVSAFNALLDHVETAFQTLRRFTSDASHQLRAPLAVVRTHVEIMMRHSSNSPELRGAMTDTYQAVKALQHLMAQLISLAKAERPVEDGDLDSFDLVECTAATARNYATVALHQDIAISFETACDQLLVSGNQIFAGEMIANLLDNSIRYGNRGGYIIVRILNSNGVLEIEDNGPGVPPAERERVFERFYRLPRNADRDGSGLGLSIVQALGRRLGATVSLETPDSGEGLKAVIKFQAVLETALEGNVAAQ
jgi:two-component system, OmpR family, sensor histidine kinase TctE